MGWSVTIPWIMSGKFWARSPGSGAALGWLPLMDPFMQLVATMDLFASIVLKGKWGTLREDHQGRVDDWILSTFF